MDVATALLCVILTAGVRIVFHACDAKEDGTWMTCHWAEMTVFAAGIAMTLQALILCLVRGKGCHGIRAGLCLAIAVQSSLCALVPGAVIRLCMMESMRCQTVMRPAVLLTGLLLAVLSVICGLRHRAMCGRGHLSSDAQ